LAIDHSANPSLVVSFHFFRLSFVNLMSPFIFTFLAWLLGK